MPITVKMKQKTVLLSNSNVELFQHYQNALHAAFGESLTIDLEPTYAPAEIRDRPDWWCKFAGSIQSVLQIDLLVTTQRTLLPFNVTLDAPAYALRTAYIDYLNGVCLEEARHHAILLPDRIQQTAEGDVLPGDMTYLVLREMLIRLVTIALCDDMSPTRDGERLMTAVNTLITEIKESRILNGGGTQSHLTPFEIHLDNTHAQHMTTILSVVKVLKMLHSNRTAITQTLDHLNDASYRLKAHIILLLHPKQAPTESLSRNWIDTTLQQCEQKVIEKAGEISFAAVASHADASVLSTVGLFATQPVLSEQPQKVIAAIRKSKKALDISKSENLSELYGLLARTKALATVLAQIDILRLVAGWVPIMAGVLNLHPLKQAIIDHGERCKTITAFSGVHDARYKTPVGIGMGRYGLVNDPNITFQAEDVAEQLEQLMNPQRLKQVATIGLNAVRVLVDMQAELGIPLVDTNRLTRLGFSPTGLATIQAPRPSNSPTPAAASRMSELQKENAQLRRENQEWSDQLQQLTQSNQIVTLTETFHRVLLTVNPDVALWNILKNQGAQLDAFCTLETHRGETALHIAAGTNNYLACNWLLEQGVNVNIHARNGDTALDKAQQEEFSEIIQYLKTQGAQTSEVIGLTQRLHEVIDDEAITDEDESVTQETIDTIEILLNQGADVNGVNQLTNAWRGDRPLHTLFVKGNQKLINWFILLGADHLLVDARRGETPYQRFNRVVFNKDRLIHFLEEIAPHILPLAENVSDSVPTHHA